MRLRVSGWSAEKRCVDCGEIRWVMAHLAAIWERCRHCKRRRALVEAMALVLTYEEEWTATGVVFKDETYLQAREYIDRWAGEF